MDRRVVFSRRTDARNTVCHFAAVNVARVASRAHGEPCGFVKIDRRVNESATPVIRDHGARRACRPQRDWLSRSRAQLCPPTLWTFLRDLSPSRTAAPVVAELSGVGDWPTIVHDDDDVSP
jgi:hypothetical protein